MRSVIHASSSTSGTGAIRVQLPSQEFAPIWRQFNEPAGHVLGDDWPARALIVRAGVPRDRILLTDVRSTDWQSLTFEGERHELHLRVTGPHSWEIAERMSAGIEDAEFNIPGQIVADFALAGTPVRNDDGSTSLKFEALTVAE